MPRTTHSVVGFRTVEVVKVVCLSVHCDGNYRVRLSHSWNILVEAHRPSARYCRVDGHRLIIFNDLFDDEQRKNTADRDRHDDVAPCAVMRSPTLKTTNLIMGTARALYAAEHLNAARSALCCLLRPFFESSVVRAPSRPNLSLTCYYVSHSTRLNFNNYYVVKVRTRTGRTTIIMLRCNTFFFFFF